MTKTMTSGKLENLGAGSLFTYGGVEWVILDRRPNIALCLAADVLEERAFDEGNKNDFAASSLRAYLNGEFVQKMVDAGASEEGFGTMAIDLTADDGLENYGKDRARIGLLTCEMYRSFRSVIPELQKWWWLATADSPRNNFVRRVYTDGTLLSHYAYYGSNGVRPLCVLKSEILVSYNEEQIKKHEATTFEKILEAAAKKAFESLERRITEGDSENEPKGVLSSVEAPEAASGAAETAKELYGIYAALQKVGFTQAQAWEIFIHNVRSA